MKNVKTMKLFKCKRKQTATQKEEQKMFKKKKST